MSANAMGRRYERLLFFAGPLALVSALALFVAFASLIQEERLRAGCLRSIGEIIEENLLSLEDSYKGDTVVVRGRISTSYWLTLQYLLIPLRVKNTRCSQEIDSANPSNGVKQPPKKLFDSLLAKAIELEKVPLDLYGIEVPPKATLSVFGTPISMQSVTLVRLIQAGLGPILLLWLGSLYHTRHRESLYIRRMTDVHMLYPHLINIYPVEICHLGDRPKIKRKSWTRFYLEFVGVPLWFSFIRIFLLLMFVGPPVFCYLMSLYLLNFGKYAEVFFISGLFVSLFAFASVLSELFPWHITKKFRVLVSGLV